MESRIVLLDTDFYFEYINGNDQAVNDLEAQGFDLIVLSSITVAELLKSCRDKKQLQKAITLLSKEEILHINESISTKSLSIIERFSLSNNSSISDSLIAATAVYYNIHLATCNTKDFVYIPGLKLLKHTVTPKRRGDGLFGMF